MSLIDHSHDRQGVSSTTLGNFHIALVVSTPPSVSSYVSAPGIEPARIYTLRHHHQRIVGMYALQPVPEILLSYAEFLHLGPLPAAADSAKTVVPALLPTRDLQFV